MAGALVLLVAGCVSSPPADTDRPGAAPLLRLSPQALGRSLVLQQQLTVAVRGQTHRLDVLLEADPAAVRLALVSLGQTAARLEWDGAQLKETRAAWLPSAVSSERILSDLQLVLWPAEAVRAALPPGWALAVADDRSRTLRQGDETVETVRYPTATRAELVQHRDGYRLDIESRAVEGATP